MEEFRVLTSPVSSILRVLEAYRTVRVLPRRLRFLVSLSFSACVHRLRENLVFSLSLSLSLSGNLSVSCTVGRL